MAGSDRVGDAGSVRVLSNRVRHDHRRGPVIRKGVVGQIYDHTDHELATEWVADIGCDFTDPEMPFEVRRFGRTITRWANQIVAWHLSHVSNATSEAVNNLAKGIKRVAFGLLKVRLHRVRCLLYAGRPNWTLLNT